MVICASIFVTALMLATLTVTVLLGLALLFWFLSEEFIIITWEGFLILLTLPSLILYSATKLELDVDASLH